MGDEAWDPTLSPITDVGTEPGITIQGRPKADTSDETDCPIESSADEPGDDE